MVGLALVGFLITVVLSYAFTEHLLKRFNVRRRVLFGEGWPLLTLLGVDVASFLAIWISSLIVMFAADVHFYYEATIVCLCAQAVWLSQHLWFYRRDHLRLRYE